MDLTTFIVSAGEVISAINAEVFSKNNNFKWWLFCPGFGHFDVVIDNNILSVLGVLL